MWETDKNGVIRNVSGELKFAIIEKQIDGEDPSWILNRVNDKNNSYYALGSYNSRDEAIRAAMARMAHEREVVALNRKSISFKKIGTYTPWGNAQNATRYQRGVTRYDTAGHGGFIVSPGVLSTFPEHLRNENGIYEEDEEWAKVALALPQLFTSLEKDFAEQTIRNSMPDIWEAHFRRKLTPGESVEKDRTHFLSEHKDDLIVISASFSQDDKSMLILTAVKGGNAENTRRDFLVPEKDYNAKSAKPMGYFIIDENKYSELKRPKPETDRLEFDSPELNRLFRR